MERSQTLNLTFRDVHANDQERLGTFEPGAVTPWNKYWKTFTFTLHKRKNYLFILNRFFEEILKLFLILKDKVT